MFFKKKKENTTKTLNPFLILFSVIIICAIASYFVTPGAYDRIIENGRTIVIADSYHSVEKNLISFFDIFRSIPYGLEGAAGMMFLVLLVGGTVEIYNKTGAIDLGVVQILKLSNKIGSQFILVIIMIVFSAIGGILGWSEQIIPFVPIIISICLALGYDSLVGVLVSGFVCMIGFSVSPTNMYTVAISHQIAELPLFSGMGYRLFILIIFEIISMAYILFYAKKIKADPSKSLMKDIDTNSLRRDFSSFENVKISSIQIFSLIILGLSFAITIFGLLKLKWQINEMAAVFLLSGVIVGILNKMSADEIIDNFIIGAKGAFAGALIIGVARSIQWVLSTGGLIDPLINFLANLLQGLSPWTTAIGIFIVITIINAFIPSGSGKAMAIMPVLIPLADMIGITRQTAILAFQFGDGISNTFWFTNGTMLIFFGLAKVPLSKWYKIIIPLEIILCLLATIFLIIAIEIGYGPF